MSEDDEAERTGTGDVATGTSAEPEDNSLGRLLTLSDGIFAIAMTLLALELKVPAASSNGRLEHALWANADTYWTYLLTFYVVWSYWSRHRRLMRSVVAVHPALIRDTFVLLVLVAAMPFPASLLGRYGGAAIALAVYGAFMAAATLTLIIMRVHVARLELAEVPETDDERFGHHWRGWLTFGVFLLCIPAGYVTSHGIYVLFLLAVPDRILWLRKLVRHRTV
jgi:uncharacterized membrane protein